MDGRFGFPGNIARPEGGGARLIYKAALVKMRGNRRRRVCPKAPGALRHQTYPGLHAPEIETSRNR